MTILGLVTGWATTSNERAVRNARLATTACNRRRVEREEVALFLAGLAGADRRVVGVHGRAVDTEVPRRVDSLGG